MWLRSDDVFMTYGPSDGALYYNFDNFLHAHELALQSKYDYKIAVIASEIDSHPELISYLKRNPEGYTIEVHGWCHDPYGNWEVDRIVPELDRAIEKIEDTFGVRPEWFCPPWHQMGGGVKEACSLLNLKLNDKYAEIRRYTGQPVDSVVFHYWKEVEVEALEKFV